MGGQLEEDDVELDGQPNDAVARVRGVAIEQENMRFSAEQVSLAQLLVKGLEVVEEHSALHERRVRRGVPRVRWSVLLRHPVRLHTLPLEDDGWLPRGAIGADGGDHGDVLSGVGAHRTNHFLPCFRERLLRLRTLRGGI